MVAQIAKKVAGDLYHIVREHASVVQNQLPDNEIKNLIIEMIGIGIFGSLVSSYVMKTTRPATLLYGVVAGTIVFFNCTFPLQYKHYPTIKHMVGGGIRGKIWKMNNFIMDSFRHFKYKDDRQIKLAVGIIALAVAAGIIPSIALGLNLADKVIYGLASGVFSFFVVANVNLTFPRGLAGHQGGGGVAAGAGPRHGKHR